MNRKKFLLCNISFHGNNTCVAAELVVSDFQQFSENENTVQYIIIYGIIVGSIDIICQVTPYKYYYARK
jgi:hypothetical protein